MLQFSLSQITEPESQSQGSNPFTNDFKCSINVTRKLHRKNPGLNEKIVSLFHEAPGDISYGSKGSKRHRRKDELPPSRPVFGRILSVAGGQSYDQELALRS